MNNYNDGLIYTNEKCVACNKCVARCDVAGANVASFVAGKSSISVDSSKCSNCGKCISVCSHGARGFRDDTERFFMDLNMGEKLSVILDSTFFAHYQGSYHKVIGYLKSIGVEKVYSTSFGADVSIWAHMHYLIENEDKPAKEKAFISQTCPAAVNVIEKYHPNLIEKIIPVHSPSLCTAIYVKKYLKDRNPIAYISPCIAVKDEIDNSSASGYLDYGITFSNLMKELGGKEIDSYNEKPDLVGIGFGELTSVFGYFTECMSFFFPRGTKMRQYSSLEENTFYLLDQATIDKYEYIQPFMAEFIACANGCQEGPGIDRDSFCPEEVRNTYSKFRNKVFETFGTDLPYEKAREELDEHFKDLSLSDFSRTFKNRYVEPEDFSDAKYEEIFLSMLKDTETKRHIDCGSCGYNSCREMANAIANGYSRKESCIHYMNDILGRRYMYDSLTNLYSRDAFIKLVQEQLNSDTKKTYLVSYGNINKLNLINDIYGYSMGNRLITAVADELHHIMPGDCIVGYMGSGSYCVFASDSQETRKCFTRREAFDFSSIGIKHPVTVRFGLYVVNESSEDIRSAITYASMAANECISELENTYYYFTGELHDRVHNDSDLISQMQPAINNHEFVLWYQPQYSSGEGELFGAEVLCRWIKPSGEIISPGVFIPLAEKSGFITTLDRVIWDMAFAAVRKWIDGGLKPVPISLNISRISLQNDYFVEYIKELTKKYDVPTKLIHFEITESAYFTNQKEMIVRVKKLRDLGFIIAMDDFGSGYSSLNSLKDIPIDILKLDMGFVRDETNLDRGRTIISSIARLARSLDYISIAEGVETSSQADFLRSVGVDVIQGYLYSKPMPEAEFIKVLENAADHAIIEKKEVFEKIEIGNFFDPSSYENALFEAFSGPSLLFEYSETGEKINVVKISKKASELMGCTGMEFSDVRAMLSIFLAKTLSGRTITDTTKRSIASGKEEQCTVEFRQVSTGMTVWFKTHIWEISRTGQNHILYSIVEDISNEKLVESTLELSNNQLSLLLDSAKVGMCLMQANLDVRNFPESLRMKVLRVNREFVELSNYMESEVLMWSQKELLGVIHPMDRPKVLATAFRHIKDSEPFSVDYRAHSKSGDYMKVRMMGSIKRQDDNTLLIASNYIVLS